LGRPVPPAMISTIVVVGFPRDVCVRERKNTVRHLPGFETAHYIVKSQTVFAKFDSHEHAVAAAERLSSEPFDMDEPWLGSLQAELAKRDLEMRDDQQHRGTVWQPPPIARAMPAAVNGVAASPQTLVVVSKEHAQGLPPQSIGEIYSVMSGYESHSVDGYGSVSVSFSTAEDAVGAVEQAGAMGMQAELRPVPGASPAPAHSSYTPSTPRFGDGSFPAGGFHAAPMAAAPAAKRPRFGEPGHGPAVDTLAVFKVQEQGLTPEGLNEMFAQMQGFLATQYNPRLESCFVKFQSPEEAVSALQQAAAVGLQAEMAKRSFNLRR